MATHSGILAWKIPEEPGGLQSMKSQRVGHDLATERARTSSPHSKLCEGRGSVQHEH